MWLPVAIFAYIIIMKLSILDAQMFGSLQAMAFECHKITDMSILQLGIQNNG